MTDAELIQKLSDRIQELEYRMEIAGETMATLHQEGIKLALRGGRENRILSERIDKLENPEAK